MPVIPFPDHGRIVRVRRLCSGSVAHWRKLGDRRTGKPSQCLAPFPALPSSSLSNPAQREKATIRDRHRVSRCAAASRRQNSHNRKRWHNALSVTLPTLRARITRVSRPPSSAKPPVRRRTPSNQSGLQRRPRRAGSAKDRRRSSHPGRPIPSGVLPAAPAPAPCRRCVATMKTVRRARTAPGPANLRRRRLYGRRHARHVPRLRRRPDRARRRRHAGRPTNRRGFPSASAR